MTELSVVVPTYNRCAVLARTLSLLCEQTLAAERYELLVVDDGSSDGTAAIVTEFAARAAVRTRYLRHDNRGPGYTQNRGIHAALAPLVVLIADDIFVTPGTLEAHLDLHHQHPQAHVAVAGKVVQSPELPDNAFLRHWDPWENDLLGACDELQYIFFWGCNVSFKREFVLRHGVFLERRGAAMEDVELGYRLSRQGGMRLLYGRQALGYHHHLETIDSACRRAFERGENFDILTDNVADPLLYARLRLIGPPAHRPASGTLAPTERLYGHEQAASWEAWRTHWRRQLVYRLAFNRVTVPLLWLPLLRRAERDPRFAPLVGARMVFGTIMYFINRGLDALRSRQTPPVSRMTL
jgi:glycosyltransferase involved in cell wall biosynthesis